MHGTYMKTTAIILAAGQGKRMKANCPKQYLLLKEKPVLYYTLKVFEESLIDEIILVVGKNEKEYCITKIIEPYQFKKVNKIVEGGKERYHSVYNGLKEVNNTDYIFIHDGARPFLEQKTIEHLLVEVTKSKACIAGMPVKDTIKIADDKSRVEQTLNRNKVWQIQTPQVFEYYLIKQAYDKLFENEIENMTDDAMVVEQMTGHSITLVEAGYQNIKITTPEDLIIGEAFVNHLVSKV